MGIFPKIIRLLKHIRAALIIWFYVKTHPVAELEEKVKKWPMVRSGESRIYTMPDGGKVIFSPDRIEVTPATKQE